MRGVLRAGQSGPVAVRHSVYAIWSGREALPGRAVSLWVVQSLSGSVNRAWNRVHVIPPPPSYRALLCKAKGQ